MTPNEHRVTGALLELYLQYDPDTGIFRRNLTTNPNSVAGDIIVKLNDQGYVEVTINDIRLRGHRVAWAWVTGQWPDGDLDHINGQRWDNRFINLRKANRSQNLQNTGIKKTNKSGVTGVHFCEDRQKWVAQISVNKKPTCLGRFDAFEDAVAVRLAAQKFHYGEFAPQAPRKAHSIERTHRQ